jgi:hypothetical protein
VLVTVLVPVFGHHDPFAAASDHRASCMGRPSSWHYSKPVVICCSNLYYLYCFIHVMQFNFQN